MDFYDTFFFMAGGLFEVNEEVCLIYYTYIEKVRGAFAHKIDKRLTSKRIECKVLFCPRTHKYLFIYDDEIEVGN